MPRGLLGCYAISLATRQQPVFGGPGEVLDQEMKTQRETTKAWWISPITVF